jgi:hypothetical protein
MLIKYRTLKHTDFTENLINWVTKQNSMRFFDILLAAN